MFEMCSTLVVLPIILGIICVWTIAITSILQYLLSIRNKRSAETTAKFLEQIHQLNDEHVNLSRRIEGLNKKADAAFYEFIGM